MKLHKNVIEMYKIAQMQKQIMKLHKKKENNTKRTTVGDLF